MTADRRFSEAEVADILERATRDLGGPTPTAGAGMTLAELQDVANEVGIPPARVAAAAGSVAGHSVERPKATLLGQPRRVEHVVSLPRAPTDREWERMVVDLREVFGSKGELDGQGNLKTWLYRHLHVHVEPHADGYRIRMDDTNGDAGGLVGAGIACLVAAGFFGFLLLSPTVSGGEVGFVTTVAALMGAGGVGLLTYARRSLPRWATQRANQFAAFGARAKALLAAGDEGRSPS